jgi:hypothetical protein
MGPATFKMRTGNSALELECVSKAEDSEEGALAVEEEEMGMGQGYLKKVFNYPKTLSFYYPKNLNFYCPKNLKHFHPKNLQFLLSIIL